MTDIHGEREEVCFTEEINTPAEDFCSSELKVVFDKVIEADLPIEFPMENTLVKE